MMNDASEPGQVSKRGNATGPGDVGGPGEASHSGRSAASNLSPESAVVMETGRPMDIARHLIGTRLNHFRIEETIGGGGMGVVFRAIDESLGRDVAVKVVPMADDDTEVHRRFRNEAMTAAKLDHPRIAKVFEVGVSGRWHYIVFEYVRGTNIRDLVRRRGPMAVRDVITLARQLSDALDHASVRGVTHRDVKPSNIVLSDGRAKLVDMGLARFERPDADETASGTTLGTFDYISPEQAKDPRSADLRSDFYSLGCTLFFMLTGRPPFGGGTMLQKLLAHGSEPPPDVRRWREDAPESLVAVIERLMAKSPDQRYQDGATLTADLEAITDRSIAGRFGGVRIGSSDRPSPDSAAGPVRRVPPVWWRRWVPPAAALSVAFAVAGGLQWQSSRTPDVVSSIRTDSAGLSSQSIRANRSPAYDPAGDERDRSDAGPLTGRPSSPGRRAVSIEDSTASSGADVEALALPVERREPIEFAGVDRNIDSRIDDGFGREASAATPLRDSYAFGPSTPAGRAFDNAAMSLADPQSNRSRGDVADRPGIAFPDPTVGATRGDGTGGGFGVEGFAVDDFTGDGFPSEAGPTGDAATAGGSDLTAGATRFGPTGFEVLGSGSPRPFTADGRSAGGGMRSIVVAEVSRDEEPMAFPDGSWRVGSLSDAVELADLVDIELIELSDPIVVSGPFRIGAGDLTIQPASGGSVVVFDPSLAGSGLDDRGGSPSFGRDRAGVDPPDGLSAMVTITDGNLELRDLQLVMIDSAANGSGVAAAFRTDVRTGGTAADRTGSEPTAIRGRAPTAETALVDIRGGGSLRLDHCAVTIPGPTADPNALIAGSRGSVIRLSTSAAAETDPGGGSRSGIAGASSDERSTVTPGGARFIDLRETTFRVAGSLITATPASSVELSVTDSLIVTDGPMIRSGGAAVPPGGAAAVSMTLDRTTVDARGGIAHMSMTADAPHPLPVYRTAKRCVFASSRRRAAYRWNGLRGAVTESDLISLRGVGNAYDADPTLTDPLIRWTSVDGNSRTLTVADLAAGSARWNREQTPHVSVPWTGRGPGDMAAWLRPTEDYRLVSDESPRGADLSTLPDTAAAYRWLSGRTGRQLFRRGGGLFGSAERRPSGVP